MGEKAIATFLPVIIGKIQKAMERRDTAYLKSTSENAELPPEIRKKAAEAIDRIEKCSFAKQSDSEPVTEGIRKSDH